jgi:hypothetical protein
MSLASTPEATGCALAPAKNAVKIKTKRFLSFAVLLKDTQSK